MAIRDRLKNEIGHLGRQESKFLATEFIIQTEELGDLFAKLKLSVFQLGISPYIFASIIIQVLCYFVPILIKLQKEGLDGNEKIKRDI